jgi:hypothetical protein
MLLFRSMVSPRYSPDSWLFINAIVVAYSGLVLFLLSGGLSFRKFAHESYYIYNVVTSLIWLVQVFLIGITYGFHEWKRKIEGILALFFTIQSVLVLLKKHHGKDPSEHMEWEVLINIVAYTYEIIVENHRLHADLDGYDLLDAVDKNVTQEL